MTNDYVLGQKSLFWLMGEGLIVTKGDKSNEFKYTAARVFVPRIIVQSTYSFKILLVTGPNEPCFVNIRE